MFKGTVNQHFTEEQFNHIADMVSRAHDTWGEYTAEGLAYHILDYLVPETAETASTVETETPKDDEPLAAWERYLLNNNKVGEWIKVRELKNLPDFSIVAGRYGTRYERQPYSWIKENGDNINFDNYYQDALLRIVCLPGGN